ncbi:N-acetylmuramoyl-L-alanine amidase [Micrococcales bacterium 31B]|nr:N-acetylmuramoyl-L-alanine amidase [Micrococcales bacterium 31B]
MFATSRRHFLLAGATLAAGGATAAGLGFPAGAQARVLVADSTIFTQAAEESGVPVSIVAAFSYAQTQWQDHDGIPSTALGYGPMHLIDGAALAEARAQADKADPMVLDTLGLAASATELTKDALRSDPAANVRGGAAVIAAKQSALGNAVGTQTDPTTWYEAVANASGFGVGATQIGFADHVMTVVRDGAAVSLPDGTELVLAGQALGPVAQRGKAVKRRQKPIPTDTPLEAPIGVDAEWIPAPYELFDSASGNYGNHDLANRPVSPALTHIVIHDTEGYYHTAIDLVTDPRYLAWHYTMNSDDGHTAQHVANKNVGWHAGNWYMNSHSIGIEHTGFAARTTWTTEAMYRASAALVRYLCRKYQIPIDRGHIIGHDQVPGILTPNIPGMHWDPGPYFDWEHYFELLGEPLDKHTAARAPRVGDVIRILPGFQGNLQPMTNCAGPGDTCELGTANFVFLHTEPDAAAPLITDLGLFQKGQESTTEVSNIGPRATAGLDFVVAELKGDWTAIWFLGLKAWFKNPHSRPTAKVLTEHRGVVVAKSDAAPTYGRAYPEAEAYSDPADVQAVTPLLYTIPAGQAYVIQDANVPVDYYKAKTFDLATPNDHIDIVGKDKYLQVSFGHRFTYVRAADVVVR